MNVKEDLAMIPYPLLCTTSMIVEVIEPSWYSALFFFQGLLLEILVLNILYSGLYIFVIALLSLISNCFIERFCSSFVEGFCLSHHLAM